LALSAAALELTGFTGDARAACEDALSSGKATEHFARMVALLGGPVDFVEHMDVHLKGGRSSAMSWRPARGQFSAIDTRGVGMAVVALGGGRRMPTDNIDHAVGFDRLLGLGAKVDAGTPLARIHARDEATAQDAMQRLAAAYQLGEAAPHHPLIADRIDPPERADARAILAILDSFGIGEAPDAAEYGDVGSNTLLHIAERCAVGQGDRAGLRAGPLHLPNLDALGLGAARQALVGTLAPGLSETPKAGVGASAAKSARARTRPPATGRSPACRCRSRGLFPADHSDLPQGVDRRADRQRPPARHPRQQARLGHHHHCRTGRGVDQTGKPICYTSIDSVFQIAAHEQHFGLSRLYEVCEEAFTLTAPMMIAGSSPARSWRNRRDVQAYRQPARFAISPPEPTLLDRLKDAGGRSLPSARFPTSTRVTV